MIHVQGTEAGLRHSTKVSYSFTRPVLLSTDLPQAELSPASDHSPPKGRMRLRRLVFSTKLLPCSRAADHRFSVIVLTVTGLIELSGLASLRRIIKELCFGSSVFVPVAGMSVWAGTMSGIGKHQTFLRARNLHKERGARRVEVPKEDLVFDSHRDDRVKFEPFALVHSHDANSPVF